MDEAPSDVLFLQIDQVHEGHAPGTVGEDEEVAGEGHAAEERGEGLAIGRFAKSDQRAADIQLPELLDDGHADGPLAGLGDATKGLGEWGGGLDSEAGRGPVVDTLERADVAGRGVLDDPGVDEPLLVGEDEGGGELAEGEVFPTLRLQETDEAVAGALDSLGLAEALVLAE